jgi:hypothetical protein
MTLQLTRHRSILQSQAARRFRVAGFQFSSSSRSCLPSSSILHQAQAKCLNHATAAKFSTGRIGAVNGLTLPGILKIGVRPGIITKQCTLGSTSLRFLTSAAPSMHHAAELLSRAGNNNNTDEERLKARLQQLLLLLDEKTKVAKTTTTTTIMACSTIVQEGLLSRLDRALMVVGQKVQNMLHSIHDILQVWLRGAEIAAIASPICVLAPLTSALLSLEQHLIKSPKVGEATAGKIMEQISWWYTLWAVQRLGPAFVKLSQWSATRRDIFPPNLCDKLATLHTSNRIHSWRYTETLLKESFGEDWADFLEIDPKDVIGSGTVAQVYKGELTMDYDDDDNDNEENVASTRRRRKPVAIKVLHPRIYELVQRDLIFMKRIAGLIDSLPLQGMKVLGLPRAVQSFENSMGRQVDLRVEADNLRQFYENFGVMENDITHQKNDTWSLFGSGEDSSKSAKIVSVAFPKPIPGWVSRAVLVEDLITSSPLVLDEDTNAADQSKSTNASSTVVPISIFLDDDSTEGMETRRKLAKPLLKAFLQVRWSIAD